MAPCPFCGETDHEVVKRDGAPDIVVCPTMPKHQVFMSDPVLWEKALLAAVAANPPRPRLVQVPTDSGGGRADGSGESARHNREVARYEIRVPRCKIKGD